MHALPKPHQIEPHPGGQIFLSQPQQRWLARGDDGLLSTALFAGHSLVASTDDAGGFDLMYLGFRSEPFPSIEEAQRAAPSFARQVLHHMATLIQDHPL